MDMKRCTRCGVEKPTSSFTPRGELFVSECKPCRNLRNAAYKKAHPEVVRRHSQRQEKKRKDAGYYDRPDVRRRRADHAKRYYADTRLRDHWRARYAVKQAVRSGKLTRPSTCQRCDKTGKTQAHHWKGYERQHWLDVTWLCKECHRIADQTH